MKYEVAIGDVHGEFAMLVELLDKVWSHCAGHDVQLIFLGDYVDRGPNSKAVTALLRQLQGEGAICLQGNHEEFVYGSVLDGNQFIREMWMRHGGIQTRASYGVLMPTALKGGNYTAQEHADAKWMKTLPVSYETDHRVYVHAGIVPGKPMAQQSHDILRWVRPKDFNDYDMDTMEPRKHIVFGHTPSRLYQPWLDKSWSGLDTGACFPRGALSAGIFVADRPGGPVTILRVDRP